MQRPVLEHDLPPEQSVSIAQLPNWGETFAGATVATVPLIVLFLFLQRYFVRGIALTGVKG